MLSLAKMLVFLPDDAFESLKERPTWIPLLLILLVLGSISEGFIASHVDIPEVQSFSLQQYIATFTDVSDFRDALDEELTIQIEIASPVAIYIISYILLLIVLTSYFHLTTLKKYPELTTKHWLALVSWARLPLILSIAIALYGEAIGEDSTRLWLSLASWLPSNIISDHFTPLAQQIDVPMLWSIFLMVTGYRVYTDVSALKSAIIVLAPYVVFMGSWAFLLMGVAKIGIQF